MPPQTKQQFLTVAWLAGLLITVVGFFAVRTYSQIEEHSRCIANLTTSVATMDAHWSDIKASQDEIKRLLLSHIGMERAELDAISKR